MTHVNQSGGALTHRLCSQPYENAQFFHHGRIARAPEALSQKHYQNFAVYQVQRRLLEAFPSVVQNLKAQRESVGDSVALSNQSISKGHAKYRLCVCSAIGCRSLGVNSAVMNALVIQAESDTADDMVLPIRCGPHLLRLQMWNIRRC